MDNGASSYRRFLDGDDEGLARIIRDYNNGLTLYINNFINDLTLSDELSLETFAKIGIKKPHFSERSSFKTWLYAIGRNVALNYIRKNAKHRDIPIDECSEQADDEEVERSLLAEEQKIILHKAMKNLKADYRQVLWLAYFDDLSAKEIAKIMKRSVHAVESLLSRARQSLKSELDMEGYSCENL